jgi:hypothetical protein
MVKFQNRTIGVIAILLMLGASPLSVTYSFADMEDSQEDEKGQNNPKAENNQKKRLGAILTEKVVNGKLEVRHYALPDDITEEDMQRTLFLEGHISDWAYVNYKAYHSGIILFDGKASKIGENLWEISTNDMLNLDPQFDLESSVKSNGSYAVMHETASDEDLSYRVIFSGKIAETDEENVIVISFMNSSLKNSEIGQNIKFQQIGQLSINSEKSISSNQEFRNSISVR